ncbi:hypothetical protein FHG87_002386 [Trinorchestia longiramus]|nr:hypothetical protein FHG87_002386 [Trinorchestia longiramus]
MDRDSSGERTRGLPHTRPVPSALHQLATLGAKQGKSEETSHRQKTHYTPLLISTLATPKLVSVGFGDSLEARVFLLPTYICLETFYDD